MTIPRRLSLVDGRLHQRPVLDGLVTSTITSAVRPDPASGAIVTATGDFEVAVRGEAGEALIVTAVSQAIRIERAMPRASGDRPDLAATCEMPWHSRPAVIVIDHGTVEVFADGTSASFLCFPGRRWSVEVRGEATVVEARPAASGLPTDR